ncbi:MAG: efflux RND transporter periplasmic adaptor subunit [Planctomycetes bacterium]|nr:efflux RND transporter periplasmic adaptor subunit [Planctomycetota bacterium]
MQTKRLIQRAGSILTLAMLLLVGYAGHHTGWSFSLAHAVPDHKHSDAAGKAAAETAAHGAGKDHEHDENSGVIHFRSAESVERSGVSTIRLDRSQISDMVIANGEITYDQKLMARLSSRVPGTVWRVEKFWGDSVKAGDVLALIEATDVGKLKADFLTALAESETHAANLASMEKGSASIPERQIRLARLTLRASHIRLLNAEQALVNLGLKIRSEEFADLSDIEEAQKIHFLGLPPELAKTLDPESTTSNLLPIVAPFDGIVIGRDVGQGEVVEPSKPLFQIADVRRMWITLQVQKEDYQKVAIGQPVSFHVDGLPTELKSQISWISTEANEETRTLQVRAEIENTIAHPTAPTIAGRRLLRANVFGTGRIEVQTKPDAFVVPNECVHYDEGRHIIFVKTGETDFSSRVVECGIRTATHTEIIGAVAEGDEVACHGSHVLKSQMLLSKLDSGAP